MANKVHPWYDYSRLHSYNAIMNFVVGGRGIGKTYGAKKRAIKRGIHLERKFILLRRFNKELTKAKATFFSDVAREFPGYDFREHKNEAQYAPSDTADDLKRPWITIGYFKSLSQAQQDKGGSFPDVDTILFDEFIIEKGHMRYLPDEANAFLNFYATVDRWSDRVKVFFLANSVSIMNPYFIEWDLMPSLDQETYEDEFITKDAGNRKNYIAVHFPDSKDFQNSIFKTAFGQFIKDTEYAEYAAGNKFADNNASLLKMKTGEAKYQFSLLLKQGLYSVWYDYRKHKYYMHEKQPKEPIVWTVYPEFMGHDKTLLLKTDPPIAMLKTAFRHERMFFDNPKTRNAFAELHKR